MSRDYAAFEPIDVPHDLLAWIEDLWGIPAAAVASGNRFYRRSGRDEVWISHAVVHPPIPPRVHAIGTRLIDRAPPAGYPGTAFLRRYGHLATRRVVDLDDAQLTVFLSGATLRDVPGDLPGYHIVRYRGATVGRAIRRGDDLECELPRTLRLRAPTP